MEFNYKGSKKGGSKKRCPNKNVNYVVEKNKLWNKVSDQHALLRQILSTCNTVKKYREYNRWGGSTILYKHRIYKDKMFINKLKQSKIVLDSLDDILGNNAPMKDIQELITPTDI